MSAEKLARGSENLFGPGRFEVGDAAIFVKTKYTEKGPNRLPDKEDKPPTVARGTVEIIREPSGTDYPLISETSRGSGGRAFADRPPYTLFTPGEVMELLKDHPKLREVLSKDDAAMNDTQHNAVLSDILLRAVRQRQETMWPNAYGGSTH